MLCGPGWGKGCGDHSRARAGSSARTRGLDSCPLPGAALAPSGTSLSAEKRWDFCTHGARDPRPLSFSLFLLAPPP